MKKWNHWIGVLIFLLAGTHSQLGFANNPLMPVDRALQYVWQSNPWLNQNQNTLILDQERESEIGLHYLFVQKHQGIPVYGGSIKVNMSRGGTILSCFNHLLLIDQMLPTFQTSVQSKNIFDVYLLHDTKWIQARVIKQANALGEIEEKIYSLDGKLLQSKMLDLFARKDTLVQTLVFNPDPLTSAQKTYGLNGLYKNNGGGDSPELTAERKWVNVQIELENDTFYASSPYIRIQDLENPVQTVFKSNAANFAFNRSQSAFREFNCLYHIETFRKYLSGIGLPLTNMGVIQVDPTAYQGQDQSRFSYSMSEPALYYGTGGVPDAEDADVIIHEYTHAINYFVAPNTIGGNERLAVEEANADFMACQYSRAISPFNWRWVFNWDGHNEYWNGRNANSSNKYPQDLNTDPYVSSLIWSSMLNDISEDMGRDLITRLLLNSVASYAPNISMQTAADLLMQADSILYGNKYYDGLKYRFEQRGFSISNGLNTHKNTIPGFRIMNSEGFANGSGSLRLINEKQESLYVKLFNLNGDLVQTIQDTKGEIEMAPNEYASGIYLIQVEDSKGNTQHSKLIRY